MNEKKRVKKKYREDLIKNDKSPLFSKKKQPQNNKNR